MSKIFEKGIDKRLTICYTTEAVKKGRIRGRIERRTSRKRRKKIEKSLKKFEKAIDKQVTICYTSRVADRKPNNRRG